MGFYKKIIETNNRIETLKKGMVLNRKVFPKRGFPSINIPTWTAVIMSATRIKKITEKSKIAHKEKCSKP